ncbi:uncharacterized protein [Littorina saxatilis]|uniref:EF-hand domain-containing protein n=2 Tax=Littorina saxatilis TaxID=31220 RepID=A0AAN9G532_9CAEN
MLLIIFLTLIPACIGFSQCGGLSPGEMAHRLFQDADRDHDGHLALAEMLFLFQAFDQNDDGRITRQEFLHHVRQTEPDMVQWYDKLYNTFDMDGDHNLDLHDYIHLYMETDPRNDNTVTEAAFIGYWTVLYQALLDMQPGSC